MKSHPSLRDQNILWSPALAYAVGLIVTDGNLSSDKRHIVLRSSDKQLLETYKNCLNIGHCSIGITIKNGYSKRPSFRVQYGNVKFYKWLQKIGIPENKTYMIGKLDIPDDVFPDFLRGHIDGDGSITTYVDTYNVFKNSSYIYERLCVRLLTASKTHIYWLQKRISETIYVKGSIHVRIPKETNRVPMYILKFGKKESKILLSKIYYSKNVPCLKRKQKIAEKFLNV